MSHISVVLRTRNAATIYGKWFDNCLKSLRKQTLRDFELIVVDVGSKDETLNKVERIGLKAKIVIGKGSMSKARWLGTESASNNVVFFLDADQELEPGVLNEVLDLMRTNDCVIVPEKSLGVNLISSALAAERNYLFLTLLTIYPGFPRAYERDKYLEAMQSIRRTELREVFEDVTAYERYLKLLGSPKIARTKSMLYHHERSTLEQFFRRELKNGLALPNFFKANTREGKQDIKNYAFLEPRIFQSRYGIVLFLLKGMKGLAWIIGAIWAILTKHT